MAYVSRKRRKCKWQQFRCYGPTFALAMMLGLATTYIAWYAYGQSLRSFSTRQYVDGFLVAFFMGPVLIGFLRGLRRHRRHLTRSTYGRLV